MMGCGISGSSWWNAAVESDASGRGADGWSAGGAEFVAVKVEGVRAEEAATEATEAVEVA